MDRDAVTGWTRSRFVAVTLAVGLCVSTCGPPPVVLVTIVTDLPTSALPTLRLRSVASLNPIRFGFDDRLLSLGNLAGQDTLPQSFSLRPSMTAPAIAVLDNSDQMVADDPLNPPSLRRVVRLQFVPNGGAALVFIHHGCLATITPPVGTSCPGSMATCTVSQWCEVRGLTCGNDGCCRSVDLGAADIVAIDGGVDASATAVTTISPSSCSAMDASADGAVDAAADAPHSG